MTTPSPVSPDPASLLHRTPAKPLDAPWAAGDTLRWTHPEGYAFAVTYAGEFDGARVFRYALWFHGTLIDDTQFARHDTDFDLSFPVCYLGQSLSLIADSLHTEDEEDEALEEAEDDTPVDKLTATQRQFYATHGPRLDALAEPYLDDLWRRFDAERVIDALVGPSKEELEYTAQLQQVHAVHEARSSDECFASLEAAVRAAGIHAVVHPLRQTPVFAHAEGVVPARLLHVTLHIDSRRQAAPYPIVMRWEWDDPMPTAVEVLRAVLLDLWWLDSSPGYEAWCDLAHTDVEEPGTRTMYLEQIEARRGLRRFLGQRLYRELQLAATDFAAAWTREHGDDEDDEDEEGEDDDDDNDGGGMFGRGLR